MGILLKVKEQIVGYVHILIGLSQKIINFLNGPFLWSRAEQQCKGF